MRLLALTLVASLLAAPAFAAEPTLADVAAQGDVAAATRLLDDGAAIDASDAKGATALMRAAVANQPELVKLLLSRGANAGAKNTAGSTALDLAKALGNGEVVAVLDAKAAADTSNHINQVVSGIDWGAVANAAISAGQAARTATAQPRASLAAHHAAVEDLDRYLGRSKRLPFGPIKAELLRHGFVMQAPEISAERVATCRFVANGPSAPVTGLVVRVDDKTMTVIDHALLP